MKQRQCSILKDVLRYYNTVRELREETGLTVLSITHDVEEALLADRILFMNDGKKYAEGSPQEIFSSRR